MATSFYIMIGKGPKLLIGFFKSMIKLLFNVWIIAFLLILTINEDIKIVYIISITMFIGYLEVYLELSELILNSISTMNNWPFNIIKKEEILALVTQFTIIVLAVIHTILPFIVSDALIKLYG